MFLDSLVSLAFVHLMAVIIPGAGFLVVSNIALSHSRLHAFYTALGNGFAALTHAVYVLFLLSFVTHNASILEVVQYVGFFYLLYLGISLIYNSFKIKDSSLSQNKVDGLEGSDFKPISKSKAFKYGYFTDLLNPQVALFFISIFSLYISPETSLFHKIIFASEVTLVTYLWFTFVAYTFSNKKAQNLLRKKLRYVRIVSGVTLILFAFKVLLS